MPERNRVFISYAHADPPHYVEDVQKHLRTTLRNIDEFETWSDDRIDLAEDWEREIRDALNRSACAILLISVEFLNSDYVYEQELPAILSQAKDGELGLIPVFVSKVTKRALSVEFPYRGKTEKFDLASVQGPNGPSEPLDAMEPSARTEVLSKLAAQVADWLEKKAPARPAKERAVRPKSASPPVSPPTGGPSC